MLAGQVFEEMAALKGIARARRKLWIAHPVILDPAQAFSADRGRAEILPKIRARRLSLLDQFVDELVERPCRQDRAIEVQQHDQRFQYRHSACRAGAKTP